MRRLVIAFAATFGLTAATSLGAAADISLTETTQVTLSCNDGHSVVLFADATMLSNLTSDVNAINASGTGTTCTLDTASIDSTTMSTSDWTVYDYNPSENGIHPRRSGDSMPPTTTDGGMTWTFNFKPDIFTALFTTTDPSVTGDDYGKTLTDNIGVSGDAANFTTQKNGGDCVSNVPAVVRFYFTSHSSSGSSSPAPGQPVMGGTPPAGFYTNFWWSDGVNMQMTSGMQNKTLTEPMTPGDWSDWDGKNAASSPTLMQAFTEAAQNVQSIGLSFGGNCFFETGVTPTPDTFTNEVFSSQFSVG